MYAVVLRRANGRYVKRLEMTRSKYAAKKLKLWWRDKYDDSYRIEVEPFTNPRG